MCADIQKKHIWDIKIKGVHPYILENKNEVGHLAGHLTLKANTAFNRMLSMFIKWMNF